MAAALAVSAHGGSREKATVTGSGLSATTAYSLVITEADGSTTTRPVTSDGSGAFTFTYVPQGPGTVTYSLNAATPTVVVATVSGSTRK